MKVVVILDVTPAAGEASRDREAVHETLESEVEALVLDVPNASGGMSAHEVKVAGIGHDVAEASLSFAQRKQYARQD